MTALRQHIRSLAYQAAFQHAACLLQRRHVSTSAVQVLYVTERAVFRLRPEGGCLELCEVAPGVDVERDVMQLMQFRPHVSPALRTMDARCFK